MSLTQKGIIFICIVLVAGRRGYDHENLHRWHAKERCIFVQYVAAGWRRCDPQEFVWASGLLYNPEDFNPTRRQKKGFTVCAAQPCSTVSNSNNLYILSNKKKEADYIFIHQHCRLSFLYNNYIC